MLAILLVAAATSDAQTRTRRTATAHQLTTPLAIDGSLDEPFYTTVRPSSDFVQIEPEDGAPATQKIEMWIGFDREALYVAFRCWESRMDMVVAKEMRRDNSAMWGGDDVVVLYLDTFNDGRNGVQFLVNSIGGRGDGQATNDGAYNGDYNMIWDASTGRFDGGWTIEMAIPFKSLRYRPGAEQIWGINVVRANRWKNELAFFNPSPKERGQPGVHYSSATGLLQGITPPPGSRNLELKPYAISNASGRAITGRGVENDLVADVGVDAKYGITQNMVADFTYNTDFAQVEADQQQVNLTRFSLFFPEKRDFFLENQGLFTFGGASPNQSASSSNTPILFYSRRIGLESGQVVPIRGGGRLTGRVGRYTLGLINIQTGEEEAVAAEPTNFSVLRLRRDVMGRSSVGLMMTGRNATGDGRQDSLAYGVDGAFGFFQSLTINTYWARTENHLRTGRGDRASYLGQLDYSGDRYGLRLERLVVGDAFNPGVGYLRRPDMRRHFGLARFSPRPQRNRVVRKYSWSGSINYVENGAGVLETREHEGEFVIDFLNTDRFTATYTDTFEYLPRAFQISNRVTVPAGEYDFGTTRVEYLRAGRRRLSGTLSLETGGFYNGDRTAVGLSAGRMNFSARLSLEPTFTINKVELAEGSFTSKVLGTRLTYSATPFLFTSAFLQYNSATRSLSTNVRLRWEYRPGSELFIVYNDERDTFARAFPDLTNRAFIIKINRLFRL